MKEGSIRDVGTPNLHCIFTEFGAFALQKFMYAKALKKPCAEQAGGFGTLIKAGAVGKFIA